LCAVPRTSHRRADRGGWVEIRRRFRRGRDERVAQSPGSAFLRGPSRGYAPAGVRQHLPEVRHTCGVARHGSQRLGVLLPAGERTPDTLKGCRSRCPGGVSTRTPPRTARAGVAGADRCPGRVRRRGGHLGARREGGKRRAPASAGSAPNLWGRAPQPTPHASHGGAAPPWGASAPFTRRPHWRRTTAIPPSELMDLWCAIPVLF